MNKTSNWVVGSNLVRVTDYMCVHHRHSPFSLLYPLPQISGSTTG